MSVLGFFGYTALLIGSSLELFGLDLYLLHYVPGGMFELILPIWLIGQRIRFIHKRFQAFQF